MGLATDGLKRCMRASTWLLEIGKVNRAKGRSISSYNSKHAHLLACISLEPPAHFMQRVPSVKSHSHLQYTALPRSSGKQARVTPRHQPGSCRYLGQHRFLIPRLSVVLCFHVEHPVSKYFVSCEIRLSISFCTLSSHLHRYLALSHSQVAIFDFESFELVHPRFDLVSAPQFCAHSFRVFMYATWETDPEEAVNPGASSMPVR